MDSVAAGPPMSVCTQPGCAELTLTGVSRNSFARWTVQALSLAAGFPLEIDARIVEQDQLSRAPGEYFQGGRRDRIGVGQVTGEAGALPTDFLHFRESPIAWQAVDQGDTRALLRKPARISRAHAPGGAGDDRAAAGQLIVHVRYTR